MNFPIPKSGQVIRYAYLWKVEALRGQEEGVKDRPCAVVLVAKNENDEKIVTVLPITHSTPINPSLAIAQEYSSRSE